jgi:hypothetical protein
LSLHFFAQNVAKLEHFKKRCLYQFPSLDLTKKFSVHKHKRHGENTCKKMSATICVTNSFISDEKKSCANGITPAMLRLCCDQCKMYLKDKYKTVFNPFLTSFTIEDSMLVDHFYKKKMEF